MNQQIIDYLQTNKGSYSKESLVEQLKNSGYNDNEILESVNAVYQEEEVPIPQANNVNIQAPQEGKKSVWKIVLIVGAIIFGVGLVIVLIIGVIVMSSLDSARDKAKEASVKSTISATVPAAILCMDDENDPTNLVPGTSICEESNGIWSDLGLIGQWGIMVDGDVSDGTFEYTATYGTEDNYTATCSETGCTFDE